MTAFAPVFISHGAPTFALDPGLVVIEEGSLEAGLQVIGNGEV